MNRRKFIKTTAMAAAGVSLAASCSAPRKKAINGRIAGANAKTGHLLRTAVWEESSNRVSTGTLIIGGGVSGLSAARWLHAQGREDFLVTELDSETGGNAVSGRNDISAYPRGAHYIPLPNNDLTEYISFLQEADVITAIDASGLPVINDYFLCFEPQERLYINGFWQEGLIPEFSVPAAEREQIKNFLAQMNVFRLAKGADGKDAFTIPVDNSSADEVFRRLDNITMKEWLLQNNFTSSHLHWYVNYSCRDDFGTEFSKISAWAGIHYFAGRKGIAANAPPQSVITWPEGNARLVKQLQKSFESKILRNTLAIKIKSTGAGIEACVKDAVTGAVTIVTAKNCIMAVPQFIAARLLDYSKEKIDLIAKHFHYYPWMVANVSVNSLSERNGAPLAWDNVFYNSRSLGYVNANHQSLEKGQKQVLTFYYPLTDGAPADERRKAFENTFDDWAAVIMADLSAAHANAAEAVEYLDVWVWGHGMISPQPGFIHGEVKRRMQQPLQKKIFFAHTDIAGISVFEEAFYSGIRAAKEVLKN